MADKVLVPYVIPYDFSAVAAGDTSATSPSISTGPFVFIWTTLGVYFDAASTEDVSILIRDEGKSRDFTKDKVHLMALLNQEDYKYYLPAPWRFNKNSSIFIEILNNHASTAATFDIAFIGYLEMPINAFSDE